MHDFLWFTIFILYVIESLNPEAIVNASSQFLNNGMATYLEDTVQTLTYVKPLNRSVENKKEGVLLHESVSTKFMVLLSKTPENIDLTSPLLT